MKSDNLKRFLIGFRQSSTLPLQAVRNIYMAEKLGFLQNPYASGFRFGLLKRQGR